MADLIGLGRRFADGRDIFWYQLFVFETQHETVSRSNRTIGGGNDVVEKSVLRTFEGPTYGRIIGEFRGLDVSVEYIIIKKSPVWHQLPSFVSGSFLASNSTLAKIGLTENRVRYLHTLCHPIFGLCSSKKSTFHGRRIGRSILN